LGRTIQIQSDRQAFYQPEKILNAVQNKLEETRKAGEKIDYLTFVADGEPTLDINLEREIDLLKSLGIPIAVITNTSLIWQKEVRCALMKSDLVSLKVDTVDERIWRKVDRPHRLLKLSSILDEALAFVKAFNGKLITETMLIANVNDTDDSLKATAGFLGLLQPNIAYLSIPTRPPAEKWVRSPDEHIINRAYQIFEETVQDVEYLTGYEGNAFALTGNIEADILSITSVHPMREDSVEKFLDRADTNWDTIHRMIDKGLLIETKYGKNKFYLRKFTK
jgi:wyosine [tRNA(Phe)-imidazoG37] synthetase (radical SAM superfamily)